MAYPHYWPNLRRRPLFFVQLQPEHYINVKTEKFIKNIFFYRQIRKTITDIENETYWNLKSPYLQRKIIAGNSCFD